MNLELPEQISSSSTTDAEEKFINPLNAVHDNKYAWWSKTKKDLGCRNLNVYHTVIRENTIQHYGGIQIWIKPKESPMFMTSWDNESRLRIHGLWTAQTFTSLQKR